jgi:glycerol-1-phosphate dehydrogenase [NAD(P)+]
LEPKEVSVEDCLPENEAIEPVVREAFADIDPTGEVGEECWNNYSQKLEHWRGCRPQLERFLKNWPRHRDEMGEMVVSPERLGKALEESEASARFGELDPPVPRDTAFWALRNCHLMRDRFTLTDLLFFLGWWNDEFVEKLFDRARAAGGGL